MNAIEIKEKHAELSDKKSESSKIRYTEEGYIFLDDIISLMNKWIPSSGKKRLSESVNLIVHDYLGEYDVVSFDKLNDVAVLILPRKGPRKTPAREQWRKLCNAFGLQFPKQLLEPKKMKSKSSISVDTARDFHNRICAIQIMLSELELELKQFCDAASE